MATFKAVVFNGGRHIKQDGTTNIKIRIYHNKSAQYIPTDYFVKPDDMGDDGYILSQLSYSEEFNYELGKLIQRLRELSIRIGTSRSSKMTCSELKEELQKMLLPESEFIDFVAFARDIISKTVKRKTSEWYVSSLNSFIEFYGRERIDINCIKSTTLDEYMNYLYAKRIVIKSKQKGIPNKVRYLEHGTVNNYMRGIRSLYNKAKAFYNDEDLELIRVPRDPFKKVDIPEYQHKRKNLQIEDIKKIRDAEFEDKRTQMAKDVFMIQFYLMGINIGDLVISAQEKYNRVNYERAKVSTKKNRKKISMSVRIEPELQTLINKYSSDGFLSDIKNRCTNQYNLLKIVNRELKTVSQELELGIPLSTNWARHSWASIARNKANIAKADVDFCLAHINKDYKMADIYIEVDYGVCDRANRAVLDLLLKK